MIRVVRGSRARRAFATAVIVAFVATITAASSRADGDPASDYLLTQNVYLPLRAPSPAATSALQETAAGVYAHGNRIKVAVIFSVDDLGALPSLFGQPTEYAHFLGVELALWYVGPLLVVMPSGFGIYDGGHSTAAEERVLGGLHVSAATPDDLAASATGAVQALAAAAALSSPDVRAPLVTAHPASAVRGKAASLRFDVFDDSGRSRALVRVYENRALIATLRTPSVFHIGTRNVVVRWQVPVRLASRQLRFCVVASDPAGNRSPQTCAPFLRVR